MNHLDYRIRVGIVSYLNTRPLLYGIEHSPVRKQIELIQDYPARIASQLTDGSIDVGLVPVAVIPRLTQSHIITDYCIGCNGQVASVCIFSEVPLEEVKQVLLDYQSRTSVSLAKVLLKEYWKLSPKLTDTSTEYQSQIRGRTAGLLIGDRALAQRKISPYIYDLGEAWQEHTGLPFAFACWIANKELPAEFISAFNEANKWGVNQIEQVIKENPSDVFDLKKYYSSYINYFFDEQKRVGLNLFLDKITDLTFVR